MSQRQHPKSIDEIRRDVSQMLDRLPSHSPISATVVFKVDPRKVSVFVRKADALTEATNKLPGCTIFVYQKNKPIGPHSDESEQYLIYEDWESVAQFRTQWNSEHLKSFQNSVGELVVAPPDLNFYHGWEETEQVLVHSTGQTLCWDSDGKRISCDGSGQDAAFASGVPIPRERFRDNNNGTVTDRLTGLIWLKDGNRFGDVSWSQALRNANHLSSGSGGLSDGSVPGDWRLPNIREMRSLLDYSAVSPMITTDHPFVDVQQAIYWTSTTLASAPRLAWMITTAIGPSVFDLKENPNCMWPVRGTENVRVAQSGQTTCWNDIGEPIDGKGSGQDGDIQAGVTSPVPRFIDNADGTITDKLTGLVWLRNADAFGFRTWEQALKDCIGLCNGRHDLKDGSVAGQWRLPNVREIESLIDYGQVAPSIPAGHPFQNVRPSSYWTSTSVTSAPTQAMFVILGVGPSIFENKQHPFFVWPVRDSRPARRPREY